MKRNFVISLLLVFLLSFSLAINVTQEDAQKITDIANNMSGLVNGDVNIDSINLLEKTGAEEKIESINAWLDENVSWLRFIFRMTPQISLLFFFDFIAIIWGIVYLIMRSPNYWESENKLYNYLIGTGIFAIFFFLNVPFYFARFCIYSINFVNNIVKMTLVAIGIVIAVMFLLLFFAPKFLFAIIKLFKKKKIMEGVLTNSASKEVTKDMEAIKQFREEEEFRRNAENQPNKYMERVDKFKKQMDKNIR